MLLTAAARSPCVNFNILLFDVRNYGILIISIKGDEVVELFRPVGEKEFILIEQSNFKKFPPRLPEQPIFYPVLNIQYATEIATKWNRKDVHSNFIGYVLKFNIKDVYISKFQVQTVGKSYHQEYWIPSEELDEFNNNIIGVISLVEKYT